jgi:serpin B
MKFPLIAATLAVACLTGVMLSQAEEKPVALPPAEAIELASAENKFGLDMFKKLHKKGENTFISPTSIAIAMQMARQGAAGETRTEMDKAMHLPGFDPAVANKALIQELSGRKGVTLNIANSIWADPKRINFNPTYVQDVKTNFDSEARTADFSDPKTLDVVNGWISDKTNKLIPKMLDSIEPEVLAMLINAIYFKGDWTDEFDTENTKEANFTLANGSTKKLDLMSRSKDVIYAEVDGVQIAKLPYGEDKQTAMWVALPKDTESLDALVAGLNAEQIAAWKRSVRKRPGTLKLPRFTMRYKKELNDVLIDLGMERAFDAGRADFTPMGESPMGPLFIGFVLHEAVVIVNEKGTEAAAATVVS